MIFHRPGKNAGAVVVPAGGLCYDKRKHREVFALGSK